MSLLGLILGAELSRNVSTILTLRKATAQAAYMQHPLGLSFVSCSLRSQWQDHPRMGHFSEVLLLVGQLGWLAGRLQGRRGECEAWVWARECRVDAGAREISTA